ncbi:ABC-type transport system, involved in lipoprotein release, permease component [Chitinophaga sp. YR627]|uniref:ABC transporter permease n=1 Tax=Chitinophaga sp. YR627 TaxID=1881041 RepID=UPI0008E01A47|nr:ABC transporter permease [Chitinophaga sp. YR627]SFN23346.1 ABC-type transport system, involved in lipoprotein release, permease component [Chitinophaga sp. YR627]
MLKNYFKIAWRNLFKNPQATFLNLAGLSTGLAAFLLIYLWVYDELNVDRFHEKRGQLFQIMENVKDGRGVITNNGTPALLAEALTGTMPEVEYATVTTPPSWFPEITFSTGDKPVNAAAIFAGKDYFNIFSYPLSQGNKSTVLADKEGMVISEALAMKLFHTTENIIGKTISWQIQEFKKHSTVSGVFKGTPANSSIQFDFILSFDAFKELMGIKGVLDSQNSDGPFFTYLALKKGTDVNAFNKQLSELLKGKSKGTPRDLFLQPYSDNYLYGEFKNGKPTGGRIAYVQLFSLIAVLIILIACINFVNLCTAKSSGRMKEIGIRKSMGARRKTLVFQFMGEFMLLVFLALIIALLLVICFLPAYNEITGKQVALRPDPTLIVSILGITFITGLIAGSYPAFYLSGFNPLEVLKGRLLKGSAGELWARKGLVIFQFTISVVFLIAVIIVYRQLNYIQHKKPGYDKEHVVYWQATGKVPADMNGFLAEIKQIPGVANASAMVANVLSTGPGVPVKYMVNGQEELISFNALQVSYDMIETLGIEMAAGQTFSRNFGAEADKIIFNETAIKAMDIKDPIGKIIDFRGKKFQIKGVTKDFHFQSLHEKIKPLYIIPDQLVGTIIVRTKAGMEQEALAKLSAFYKDYNPDFPFEYKFLDDDYQAQYIAEKRVATLSKYFSGLAMLISCLGLLGLTAFTLEKRSKEISIRKVLGATGNNIVLMFSRSYLVFVLLAAGLAVPLGWWIMNSWLQGFAYHINIGIDVFLIALGAILPVTLLSVIFIVIRVAWTNPATSLKAE